MKRLERRLIRQIHRFVYGDPSSKSIEEVRSIRETNYSKIGAEAAYAAGATA